LFFTEDSGRVSDHCPAKKTPPFDPPVERGETKRRARQAGRYHSPRASSFILSASLRGLRPRGAFIVMMLSVLPARFSPETRLLSH